jgi:ABC-type oligopeptide transport system substrate-binding subunit
MLRPSTGELLAGLHSSLTSAVLPSLPKGEAYSQLKAALHLLARLEKSWDLAHSHIAEDNADMERVLGPLADMPTPAEELFGYNDPELRQAAARNLLLQTILAKQQPSAEIEALYRRMSARDTRYIGNEK